MKKRCMRILCFVLAVSMIVISLDMPVLATGLDYKAEDVIGEDIVLDAEQEYYTVDESFEQTSEDTIPEDESAKLTSEEINSAGEQTTIIPDEAEETELTENSDAQSTFLSEYDGVMEMEVIELDIDDIDAEVIDADELLLQVEEAPVYYAASESYDWDQYSNYYIYNLLSEDEKKLWDALEIVCNEYLETENDLYIQTYDAGSYCRTDLVSIKTTSIDEERISELVLLFVYSHPQYYYLRGGVARLVDTDRIYVAISAYENFADGTERLQVTNNIKTLLDSWYTQIDVCETEEEKVYMIHNLICEKTTYNHDVLEDDNKITEEEEVVAFTQTAYSVFCLDKTVCAGYTKAFTWVCNGAGIDAYGVTSYNHAWNKVRVNDSWYNIDCTWDDQSGYYHYYYYLRNDDVFSEDSHTELDVWTNYLPLCTLDSGAYYDSKGSLPVVTQQVATPIIGVIKDESGYTVAMSTDTSNAKIYYTLDGSEPSEASAKSYLYTGPVLLNGDYTIRVIAVCNEYLDSEVSEKTIETIEYTVASGSCGSKITWNLDSKGVLTLMGSGAMTSYASAAKCPWYEYADSIEKVVIDEGITTIGTYAFASLAYMEECNLPSTLTQIGNYAFYCSGIKEADIPQNVSIIGEGAFSECDSLVSVSINGNIGEIGDELFSYCVSLKKLSLSDDLETIGYGMFVNCVSLDNVTLPQNLRKIKGYGFFGCQNLKSITIPQSVESIGAYAFGYCTALKTAEIHADVTALSQGFFEECSSLEQITITSPLTTIPAYFAYNCTSLTNFNIPETVTSVKGYAFAGCTELSQIYVAPTVTSISAYAFADTTAILGYANSAAQKYANTYGNEFLDIVEYGCCVQFVTNCDITLAEQYYLQGSYIAEPAEMNKIGYTFCGWYTSSTTQDDTTIWDFANDTLEEDIVLYAKWTANTYCLSFDANYEGAESIADREIIYDTAYGELPAVSRTGYTFNGWYSDALNGTLVTADSVYVTAADETLYAHWTPNSYYLVFDANGGKSDIDRMQVVYDSVVGELPIPEREGYTFNGWFTELEEGEEIVSDTVVKITSQKTLYACWTVNNYTVTLEPNGVDLADKEFSVTYDAPYGTLPVLEREGYRFKGWMLENGTVVTEDTIVETPQDHTLYASWQAKVYTIIFSAGEGSVKPSSQSATFGSAYGELPTPQRTGYTFVGWYTAQTEGELITADSIVGVARDHALYARYEANQYTVSFELNGGLLDMTEMTVTYDGVYGELPVPEQEGCIFAGWYTANEGGIAITEDTKVSILENQILYARWEYKYTVKEPIASIDDGTEVKAGTRLYLTSSTNGAKIYYTTDNTIGLSVNAESGILYEDAIIINEAVTVYAVAIKEQYNNSEKITVSYTVADETQNWGDITEADRAEYGFTDATEVPQALWIAGVPEEHDYIGKAITFEELHVYSHKTLLQPKVDYTVIYSNNVKAGTATITITGKGNYSGTIIKTFTINPLDLSDATLLDVTLPYTGRVQKATTTVTYMLNGKVVTLKAGTDFTYTYPGTNNRLADYDSNAFKVAGDHIVTITGKGNYTGTNTFTELITQKYVIGKMRLTSITNQKYTGSEIEPEVKIYNGSKRMVEGVDYTVEYSNNIAVGKATVTITGMGDYEGVRTATFNITGTALSRMKLSGFKSSLPWTGSDVEQDVTFSYTTRIGANNVTTYLEEGVDYTVSYSENIRDIGKVTVVYTGIGGYTGTIKKTYQITGLSISRAKVSGLETTMVYDGKSMIQSGYELTYTTGSGAAAVTTPMIENEDYKVSYSANHKVGTATIIFTGINGYTGTLKKTYKITAYNIATVNGNISVSEIPDQIYTKGGSTPKPVITYTNDEEVITLVEGKDYTLRYSNNNAIADKTALRAPTLTITGKGNFKGNYVVKYTITESDLSYTTMTANDIVYQNKAGICKPSIVLVDTNGKKLAAGTDYNRTISYTYATDVKVTQLVNRKYIDVVRMAGDPVDTKDIIPVGAEITATVTGINKYAGTQSVTFRYITKNISSASVTVAAQIYTGDAVEPTKDDIVVKIGKIVLNKTDYEIVGYSNNIKKGTAKVIIRGIGNYGGEKTVSFKINVKSLNYTIHYEGNAENVTGKMNASSVTISKLLTANAYRRKGYVFEGWNTKPDGSGVSYSNREKFYLKDGMTVYGTEITLYAQWSEL